MCLWGVCVLNFFLIITVINLCKNHTNFLKLCGRGWGEVKSGFLIFSGCPSKIHFSNFVCSNVIID